MEIVESTANNVEVSVKIPFPSTREAQIAYDALRIDEEPRRSAVTKTIELNENSLIVNLSGNLSKNVRVGLTSFFDNLILCCETIEAFGPPVTQKYDHY